ncbi:MAG TPA: chromate efflux transporter [Caulobacteraceae bacterium]|nr:chromate efflux transporter [Caulobacteraceae bacterium]
MDLPTDVVPAGPRSVSFRQAVEIWARVAALSFGGPAGQIAVMHRILVEEQRWLGERRFLHALNYCMLLPGPEAQQLAIYIGWLMHRTLGGLVAGALFVLPGFVSIMALSILYAEFGHLAPVAALFFGLKAAVLVVVVQAVLRLGRRSLRNRAMVAIAAGAFLALFVFKVPFPVVIGAAGLIGFAGARLGAAAFAGGAGHAATSGAEVADADTVLGEETPDHARPNLRWSLGVSAVLFVLWLAPICASWALLGGASVFTQIGAFFGRMSVVTFGGAYAVLAYVAQEAVQGYHWVSPGEMLDGLGMAETTPGPLIMVTQFVGFLAAFRHAGGMDPLLAGVLGSVLTTWVTFVPCYIWIFLGAPWVEALRHARALAAALAAVGAAVVGVILNLAVWFALHVCFGRVFEFRQFGLALEAPDPASINLPSVLLSLAAAIAAFRFKLGVIPLLVGAAVAGLAWYALSALRT